MSDALELPRVFRRWLGLMVRAGSALVVLLAMIVDAPGQSTRTHMQSLPGQLALGGAATIDGDVLKLTDGHSAGEGSLITQAGTDAGFIAAFKLLFGPRDPCDELSISHGDLPDGSFGGEGSGNGLVIRLATSERDLAKGRIRAFYTGAKVAESGLRTLRSDDFVNLLVVVTPAGELTVVHTNGQDPMLAISGVKIRSWNPPPTWRVGIGATAGADGAVQLVQGLNVQSTGPGACGDGFVAGDEECDDGPTNGCMTSCCSTVCRFQDARHTKADPNSVCADAAEASKLDTALSGPTVRLRGRCSVHRDARTVDPTGAPLRLLLNDGSGKRILDVVLPGDEYDTMRRAGWKRHVFPAGLVAQYKNTAQLEPLIQGVRVVKLVAMTTPRVMIRNFRAEVERASLPDTVTGPRFSARLSNTRELARCCLIVQTGSIDEE